MGEERKEEEKKEANKEEKKQEEKKEEEKKEVEPPEIVLKVDMHCEACARKVARALKGFQGVEDVATDSKASKVVVKGKAADPIKVCERLQKKSGKKVELISPLPKPPEAEEKKEEVKEAVKEDKKEEPPVAVTVVLQVRMHCEACAHVLQKRIRKIQGVESVETGVGNDHVIVKGVVDPGKLAEDVYKKTRKQVSIIVKEEEKKEEEKKEDGEKKEKGKATEEEDKQKQQQQQVVVDMNMMKRSHEYWPSKFYTDYSYPSPQIFSDENPNACSLM